MEKQSTLSTAAGQRAYASSSGNPRRNWGRLLTRRLGIGCHSLAQFGVRAPIRSRRDSQQIHPRGQLARDCVGGSHVRAHWRAGTLAGQPRTVMLAVRVVGLAPDSCELS